MVTGCCYFRNFGQVTLEKQDMARIGNLEFSRIFAPIYFELLVRFE